eukprot:CAMPEP_0201476824 /NCGR_PEP_ID=MMETSP0151_2-20130828/1957_1 /ASSEMBLY_ACC=CAM_ASM_000257 /TAXON_ID=200890 /ORGANISM="Paramoeba atlantica, Strain 621/1 / CCAP 1560/9" /LENGTH=211 /DNA_ID=CAMNT_0047857327 /DNA_START=109 /DNA_END=744 /DNA_ORIENTATION=+
MMKQYQQQPQARRRLNFGNNPSQCGGGAVMGVPIYDPSAVPIHGAPVRPHHSASYQPVIGSQAQHTRSYPSIQPMRKRNSSYSPGHQNRENTQNLSKTRPPSSSSSSPPTMTSGHLKTRKKSTPQVEDSQRYSPPSTPDATGSTHWASGVWYTSPPPSSLPDDFDFEDDETTTPEPCRSGVPNSSNVSNGANKQDLEILSGDLRALLRVEG